MCCSADSIIHVGTLDKLHEGKFIVDLREWSEKYTLCRPQLCYQLPAIFILQRRNYGILYRDSRLIQCAHKNLGYVDTLLVSLQETNSLAFTFIFFHKDNCKTCASDLELLPAVHVSEIAVMTRHMDLQHKVKIPCQPIISTLHTGSELTSALASRFKAAIIS